MDVPPNARVLRRVLIHAARGLAVDPATLNASASITSVYGSLDEVELVLSIEAEFGVQLTDEALAECRAAHGDADITFAGLADLIVQLVRADPASRSRRKCPECGYPMGDLPTPVCPECGARVD